MAFDIAAFRAAFPEFGDDARFPDSQIAFWAGLAELSLDPQRWGKFYPYGLQLFVAHFLALAKQNEASGQGGGVPGTGGSGNISSKRVGEVQVTYSQKTGDVDGGGEWNATSYGKQYLALLRLIGHGCYQL